MSELSEIKELLETHRKESNDWREKMTTSITEIKIHNQYTKEKLETVDALEKQSQRQKGFLYALSVIGLGGIEEFFRHLGK